MTSPLKNLHEGSGRRDLSYELAAHTKRLEEQVAETCPKNSNWFEFVGIFAETNVGPGD